ncbi:CHRD domain-containing protein [Persicitalea jodogahamensis]|uniref:CHRD domain-containing protein n=1 Tax=Persicitalea jodogahamensis TaxID=402147 RepID=A0A8J3DC19_9BACT|nr:CHRD domain-containing protein [Persicitalea jodogahamensis]GHB80753.1 hypothetical protein GCM10007390_39080 [Persicitalea jodogahamensis]
MKPISKYFLPLLLFTFLNGCKDHELGEDNMTKQNGLAISAEQAGFYSNPTASKGTMDMSYNKNTKKLEYTITYENLPSPLYNANIRIAPRGQSGPIFHSFTGQALVDLSKSGTTTGYLDIPAEREEELLNGLFYVYLNTEPNFRIAIRGQIEFYNLDRNVVKRGIVLTSQQEVPSLNTGAKGSADVLYNKNTKLLSYFISWENLAELPTGAHIHGVADRGMNAIVQHSFIDLIPKDRSGSFSNSVVVDGVKIKEAELLNGKYYFNIHNSIYPTGEIRGQIEF